MFSVLDNRKIVHNQKLNVFFSNHLSNFFTITLTLHCVLKFLKFWFYVARDSPPLTVLINACTTLEQRHMFSHLSLVGILLNIQKLVWRAKWIKNIIQLLLNKFNYIFVLRHFGYYIRIQRYHKSMKVKHPTPLKHTHFITIRFPPFSEIVLGVPG